MKAFLIILKNQSIEKYPNVNIDFYILERSKFIHMDLDSRLSKVDVNGKIVLFIQSLCRERNQDTKFLFITSYLINSVKWKLDYIIVEKRFSSN